MSTDHEVKLAIDNEEWPAGIPSQEVLWYMRKQGLPKPEGVPVAIWNNLHKVSHNHEAIADLMLTGHTKKEIAEKLDLGYTSLCITTRTPTFKAYFRQRRQEREETINRDGIHELLDVAVDTVAEILQSNSAKDQTRLQAAQFIIDQSLGKAKQEVKTESNTSVLLQFMSKVEQLRSLPPEQKPEFLVKAPSKFQNVLDALKAQDQQHVLKEVSNGEESEPQSE